MSEARGCGWAKRSSAALLKLGIMDWPQWSNPDSTVCQYRVYVKEVLERYCMDELRIGIGRHSQRLPYYVLESEPGRTPIVLRGQELPVDIACLVRHWCRLRCGLIVLRHLSGRECDAQHQSCVFCVATTAHPLVHCMALCPGACSASGVFEP